MARILFTWELGGALGHLAIIRTLAEHLHASGHRLHLATPNPKAAAWTMRDLPVEFHAAPTWHPRRTQPVERVHSYAHILHNVGYGHRQTLAAHLRAWQSLVRAIEPHVLVCETSPTALLAVRGSGMATVQIGTGFGIPPQSYPLPDFRFWDLAATGALRRDEDTLTGIVNAALSDAGGGTLTHLHEIFETALTAVCGVRELDPYRDRVTDCHVGSIGRLPGQQPSWPPGAAARVFAYLKPFPELPQLLQALQRRKVHALIYGPSLPREVVTRYRSNELQFVAEPVDVDHASRTASLAITNAGPGVTLQALCGGVPVLCFPLLLEQHVLARNIDAQGLGRFCSPWGSDRIAATLDALLDDPGFTRRAAEFAARHADLDPGVQAARLAARISKGHRSISPIPISVAGN
jgi:UDP:flavonoid glycosyltransferase YjiC (YdhE family)